MIELEVMRLDHSYHSLHGINNKVVKTSCENEAQAVTTCVPKAESSSGYRGIGRPKNELDRYVKCMLHPKNA